MQRPWKHPCSSCRPPASSTRVCRCSPPASRKRSHREGVLLNGVGSEPFYFQLFWLLDVMPWGKSHHDPVTLVPLNDNKIVGSRYINDYLMGKIMRDCKLYEIGAVTSEVCRLYIGGITSRSIVTIRGSEVQEHLSLCCQLLQLLNYEKWNIAIAKHPIINICWSNEMLKLKRVLFCS